MEHLTPNQMEWLTRSLGALNLLFWPYVAREAWRSRKLKADEADPEMPNMLAEFSLRRLDFVEDRQPVAAPIDAWLMQAESVCQELGVERQDPSAATLAARLDLVAQAQNTRTLILVDASTGRPGKALSVETFYHDVDVATNFNSRLYINALVAREALRALTAQYEKVIWLAAADVQWNFLPDGPKPLVSDARVITERIENEETFGASV